MWVYGIVLLTAILLMMLVYRYDLYDKEPWYLLGLAFLLGFAGSWGIGHVESAVLARWGGEENNFIRLPLVASTHEEAVKLLIVVFIGLTFQRHFNDPMDGIIYGSFAGLGMALEESLFYLGLTPVQTAFSGREAVRLVLHLLLGGIGGFALGMARFRMRRWPLVLLSCFGASLSLHFLWDCITLLPAEYEKLNFYRPFAVILLTLVTFGLYGVLLASAKRLSQAALRVQRPRQLWGWPFSLLFRGPRL